MINSVAQLKPDLELDLPGPSDELLFYMLKVLALETENRYLKSVEHAARRYVGCVDSNRRNNKHKVFKSAKVDLVSALENFERLQVEEWLRSNEAD